MNGQSSRSFVIATADNTSCAAAELPAVYAPSRRREWSAMRGRAAACRSTAGIVQSLPSLPIVRHGLAATVRAGAARLWDFVDACHSEDRSVAHFLPDFGAETVVALLSTRHAIEYVLIRSTSRASADRIYIGIRCPWSNPIRHNLCEATEAAAARGLRSPAAGGIVQGCTVQ